MKKTPIFILIILFMMISCQDFSKKSKKSIGYIDLNLIFETARLKSKNRGYQLIKKTIFEQKKDSNLVSQPDWSKELSFTNVLNVNQPKFKQAFSIQKSTKKSGKAEWLYRQKAPLKDGPIEISVIFSHKNGPIASIKAINTTLNWIFYKKEYLTFNFAADSALTSYSVKGGQKMMIRDSMTYEINAKILPPTL